MPGSSSTGKTGYCPQCGAPLRADTSFCTACGAAIAGAAPAPTARSQSKASRSNARRSKSEATRNNRPWLAIAAVVALLAVAAIGFALLSDSQQPTSPSIAIPTVAALAQDVPYPNVARVSPENAHMSAMSGEAVLVDVRGQEFYDMGHARGAISLPLDQLPARFSELPKDKAVLFYCTWPAEETSARAAQYLLDQGYSNVAAILGGLAAWQEIGFPMEWAALCGQVIGQLGSTGNSTGPHVHVEVWQGQSKVNPLNLVPASPDQ